jgi:DNA repair exonuclease SbcCD nuclease subunit
MKLLTTSDWHFTSACPESRKDNYPIVLENKIKFILAKSLEYKAPILQAGDITDNALLSYLAYRRLLNLIKGRADIFTVYGQHDLLYRNLGNTPIDALQDALADSFHILTTGVFSLGHGVDLYGCSFEKQIPEIVDHDNFNILLIHRLIVDQHLQEWEEKLPLANTMLNSTDFDLIISGDNHRGFIYSTGGKKQRHLINCGSLMRSKIDQIHHKPFICIFDTEERTYEKIYIPIQDWAEVFDIESKVKEEQKNEMLDSFVKALAVPGHKKVGMNFRDNIHKFMEENNIEPAVRDVVYWSLTE